MAFSIVPSDAKTELEAALALADKINEITSVSDLKQVIKTAYGLTEDEIKRADEARGSLKDAEDIIKKSKKALSEIEEEKKKTLAEYSAREVAILAAQTELDSKKAALGVESDSLYALKSELDDKQSAIDAGFAAIESQKKDLSNTQKRLDSDLEKVKKDADKLAEKLATVEAHEASLKAKSAQLQSLVAGM